MTRDQFQFRNRIKRIRDSKQHEHETPHSWQALAVDIQHSVDLRTRRAEKLPAPEVDPGLPIYQRQTEICEAIRHNQVVVISGATGSGKSTQLPLMALRCGYGAAGLIGHTQPRRIAARSVANRIAQQMGTTNGSEVAYKIRFADQTSTQTYVKLMTDGILRLYLIFIMD